ncbi:hypothetical protein ACFSUK_30585 [Sphingobium scionense]|uniref:Uncharacterized protein n=1 Tax=Sphingobium scionense TaxID=1404341 RepID=A0A7W6LUM5_9SPHN|nr:hypothetical protein [Sphingobium scionense]MBB4150754.1 hypothetical protein [Sphingobium scionense]
MLSVFAFLMQAALPSTSLSYSGRTDYQGPGTVCGAAFSVLLREGESAALIKRSAIDAELSFTTRDGDFTIHESQYATLGGKVVRHFAEGHLRRKREATSYMWTFRDAAPGSTDVSGPGVNTRRPSAALERIVFEPPRNGFVGGEKCLAGASSDKR